MIEKKKYTKDFYKDQEDGSYRSAKEILPIVKKLFRPESVIDIGCGVGYWLKVWRDDLDIKDVYGIEGPYVKPDMLKVPAELIRLQDIKLPLKLSRKFDLAMSLEVAEHLPESSADQFVKTLTEASDIVLFSAAIVGQEGTYHINEQMPEYWAEIFLKYGFKPIDYLRSKIWNNEAIEPWYKQNILFFIKADRISDFPILKQAYEATSPDYLFRVHPSLYINKWNYIVRTSTWSGYIHWRLYKLKIKIRNKFGK